MKKVLILSLCIFFLGFMMKFFHFHNNTFIMLGGLFLFFITLLIASIRKKIEPLQSLIGFSAFTWFLLLLFSIKFFPRAEILLFIALSLSLITVFYAFYIKRTKQIYLLLLSGIFAMSFYFMPSDSRYHLFSIRWNQEIASDFQTWDKYSWFLYQNDKIEEALNASENALQIAIIQEDQGWIDRIVEHQEAMNNGNWDRYLK